MLICLSNTAFKQVKEECMAVANSLKQDPPDMNISTVIREASTSPKAAKETVPIFRDWHQPIIAIVVEELVQPTQLSSIKAWQGRRNVGHILHVGELIGSLPNDGLGHVHQRLKQPVTSPLRCACSGEGSGILFVLFQSCYGICKGLLFDEFHLKPSRTCNKCL